MDDFKAALRARGFRATPGRVRLLQSLSRSRRSLSVEEIGKRLELNIATLYRALNDLAAAGLLLRGTARDGSIHFAYPRDHHHHMICADCGYSPNCKVCS